jgi:hypothetical protein
MTSIYRTIKNLLFGIAIWGSLFFSSCDNSFLETEPPTQNITTDTIFVTNKTQPFQLNFGFETSEACNWRLFQFPIWLDVSPKEGFKSENSNAVLQFTIDPNEFYFDFGFYTFPLTFDIDETQFVTYTIMLAHLGNPTMEVTPSNFVIENALEGSFEIVNRGHGILYWEVTDSPSWLNIETKQGLLEQNHTETIHFTINSNGLEPGTYEGVVKILNNANDNHYNIPVYLKLEAQNS